MTGTATLKISVKICFFSITVPITMTKTFQGSNSGAAAAMQPAEAHPAALGLPSANPTVDQILFDQLVPPPVAGQTPVWQTYCNAFAN